jgi:hypothetical protein
MIHLSPADWISRCRAQTLITIKFRGVSTLAVRAFFGGIL